MFKSTSSRSNLGSRLLLSIAALASFLTDAAGSVRAGDSWDAVFIKGVKVGYTHLWVTPLKSQGKDVLRINFDQVIVFKRDHDEVMLKLRYGTIETPEGSVLKLDTRLEMSQQTTRIKGEVRDNKMYLSMEVAGKQQEQVIDWTPDTYGPYAVELSLARSPIKEGEERKLRSFEPILDKLMILEIKAVGQEETELGDGKKRSLLRVEQKASFADGKRLPELDATYWVDPGGQILKGYVDSQGGQTTYRTTSAAAQAMPSSAARLNIVALSIIKVPEIANSQKTKDVTYRVSVRGASAAKLFPSDERQVVKESGDGKSATIHVRAMGPDSGEPTLGKIADEFLLPNPMIDSTDSLVMRHAEEAVDGRTDPWQKAVAIEEWVAKNLKNKNFENTFASASEVARDLSGDCTEHGVLAAAMSRSVGIPARVAIGLVYAPDQHGFGFHMWHEVYVNRRWVALDATFQQTTVDATHIKVLDSSLAGVAPFETFLPVASLFDKTTLKVLEIRK